MRVVLHPEARQELRSAALWYDERRPGLGVELVAEVSGILDRIVGAPLSFPLWPGLKDNKTIRRAVVPRFPYLVVFESQKRRLIVLAVAHAKRRPLYWLARTAEQSGN